LSLAQSLDQSFAAPAEPLGTQAEDALELGRLACLLGYPPYVPKSSSLPSSSSLDRSVVTAGAQLFPSLFSNLPRHRGQEAPNIPTYIPFQSAPSQTKAKKKAFELDAESIERFYSSRINEADYHSQTGIPPAPGIWISTPSTKTPSTQSSDVSRTESPSTGPADERLNKKIHQLLTGHWIFDDHGERHDFIFWCPDSQQWIGSEWDRTLGVQGWWTFLWHEDRGCLPEELANHLQRSSRQQPNPWPDNFKSASQSGGKVVPSSQDTESSNFAVGDMVLSISADLGVPVGTRGWVRSTVDDDRSNWAVVPEKIVVEFCTGTRASAHPRCFQRVGSKPSTVKSQNFQGPDGELIKSISCGRSDVPPEICYQ
jgi:hypothetical protein